MKEKPEGQIDTCSKILCKWMWFGRRTNWNGPWIRTLYCRSRHSSSNYWLYCARQARYDTRLNLVGLRETRGVIRDILAAVAAKTLPVTSKSNWLTAKLVLALAHFTWVALFAVLVLAGVGLPIPEDVPLILSGYMSNPEHSPIRQIPKMTDMDGDGVKEVVYRQVPDYLVYLMIGSGLAGVLIGDAIVFTIGRHGLEGNSFVARHLRKVMHSKRREKVERHFARHGNLTVFLGRFLFPVRSLTFAMAGLSKMSYARFLIIDGCAAAISVPAFILLGYGFAEEIDNVFAWIDRAKRMLWPVAIAFLVAIVAIYLMRRRRAAMLKTLKPAE